MIEVPYVTNLIVQVPSFKMILISAPQRVRRPSCPFLKILREQLKGRLPKKLRLLMAVPYVAHLIVQVLSFNMNLISSPQRVPRRSYPFRGKFGRSGKGSFTEKAKIVARGSVCIASERTCSKLQYDPYLISVACSQTELPISGEIWEIRESFVPEKAIIVN